MFNAMARQGVTLTLNSSQKKYTSTFIFFFLFFWQISWTYSGPRYAGSPLYSRKSGHKLQMAAHRRDVYLAFFFSGLTDQLTIHCRRLLIKVTLHCRDHCTFGTVSKSHSDKIIKCKKHFKISLPDASSS